MGQVDEKMDKILELFFEVPDRKFAVRQIAKITKIPKSTVQNYLIKLKSIGLVTKDNRASNTRLFKIKKTNYFIEKLYTSDLIEHLNTVFSPSCIILFGSFRKGDYVKNSDVDLFIETTKKAEPNLEKFERKLKHKLHISKDSDINNINKSNPRLFNNIINGIKLEG